MIDPYQNLCRAFASRERPNHFTDYKHCEECMEHDRFLRSKDNDSISFEDIGNISCSPVSFTSIDGFLYYLPGLARIAGGTGDEYFLDTFLIHMEDQERRNALSKHEKKALSDYLVYLREKMTASIEDNLDSEDLDGLIDWLNCGDH